MKAIFLFFFLFPVSTNVLAYEETFQQQVKEKDWNGAVETLREAANDCRSTNTNKCIDKIAFSRGWMYSQRAEQDEEHRKSFYERARDSYQSVLRDNPDHIATLDNLVLVLEQLNDRAGLEDVLSILINLGQNKRAAKVTIMIADLYSDNAGESAERAFTNYSRSYELDRQPQSINKMIAAFNRSPNRSQANQLWSLTEQETSLPIRRSICEAIINNGDSVDPSLHESTAVNWVAWLGRERRLTADSIIKSIDLEHNPEFQELYRRLSDLRLGLPRDVSLQINDMSLLEFRRGDGWWNQNLLRIWAFSIAAWSEGHNKLLMGDVKAANSIWMAALQYAPPPRSYRSPELEGRWGITLELMTDLARLQQLYKPVLDPEGVVFKSIERLLFRSKADAYAVNDLEAIERHHILMGKMYADLGIFSQKEHGMQSAEYQLDNAIITASRRSEKPGVIDLQPNMAKLLADGYTCKLPNQRECTPDDGKALKYYHQAAIEFLKLDAVEPAREAVESLKKFEPTPTKETILLEKVIDLRAGMTMEMLDKGSEHPDVAIKHIDLANEWHALGEDQKARESLNRALRTRASKAQIEEITKYLERSDVDKVKEMTAKIIPLSGKQ